MQWWVHLYILKNLKLNQPLLKPKHPNPPNSSKSSQNSEQKQSRVIMQNCLHPWNFGSVDQEGIMAKNLEKGSWDHAWPKVDQGRTFDVWSPANRYIDMSKDSKWCRLRGTPRMQKIVRNFLASGTCLPCSIKFPHFFIFAEHDQSLGLPAKGERKKLQNPI